MSGYEIIGNEILQGGRVVERFDGPPKEARGKALRRSLELHRAEAAGESPPPPSGVKALSAVEWKDTLRVRAAGLWAGSWSDDMAVLTNLSTGNMANLARADMELRFEPEGGGSFSPGPGGGNVVERQIFEALRVEGPMLDQMGTLHSSPGVRYVVRESGGRETVWSEKDFGEIFEVIEAPKPIRASKAPTAPKNEEA